MTVAKLQIQVSWKTLTRINTKSSSTLALYPNYRKPKKRKSLTKSEINKLYFVYRETRERITVDSLSETTQREWSTIFKVLKEEKSLEFYVNIVIFQK
jgi:hypothetical protein